MLNLLFTRCHFDCNSCFPFTNGPTMWEMRQMGMHVLLVWLKGFAAAFCMLVACMSCG